MATERATKKIETTGGHEVVIKTYLTGREFNEIQAILIRDMKVSTAGKEARVEGFNPAAVEESNKKLLELAIVSVDGVRENCADIILDFPYTETQEVMDALEEISGKKKASGQ